VQVTDDCTHPDMNFTGPTGQKTCCPSVTVTGGTEVLWREAGIDYVDAGATATDDLDGDLTDDIVETGLTEDKHLINPSAFYSRTSCREMNDTSDFTLNSGYYFLSQKGAGYTRYKAWCAFDHTDGTSYTFRHVGGLDPQVNPLDFTAVSAVCNGYHMDAINWTSPTYNNNKAYIAAGEMGTGVRDSIFGLGSSGPLPADAETADVFCVPKDESAYRDLSDESRTYNDTIHKAAGVMVHSNHYPDTQHGDGRNHNITANLDLTSPTQPQMYESSEPGKYIITYTVTDSAGNTQCQMGRRTVILRDTMPPIIALRVKTIDGTLKNQYSIDNPSDALHGLPSGDSSEPTPNEDAFNHVQTWQDDEFPHASGSEHYDNNFDATFMATRVSPANAWVVGAVVAVSAVVFGVYSKRRPSQQIIDV